MKERVFLNLGKTAGQRGRRSERGGGHSRAGSGQAAESTGGLPHQVDGPAIGSQGKQHVVADLFVPLHLLLKETGHSPKAFF